MPVAAGDDYDIIEGRDREPPDAVFKAVADDLGRLREARAVGKVRPVVHDADGEAAGSAELTHRQSDMPRAEDDQPLLRQYRLAHDKAVLRALRRHARKAAAPEIGHGRDRGQPPAEAALDHAFLTADHRLQRDRLILGQMVQNVLIDVSHSSTPLIPQCFFRTAC